MTNSILKARIGGSSNKGVKPQNEDFYGSHIPDEPQLTHKGIVTAIADGMSGCGAAQDASRYCIINFLNDYFSTPDSWTVKNSGQKILSATNSWLYSQGQRQFESSNSMVSTLSILIFKSTTAHIFHIGDSRIYRIRSGNIELLTHDHRIYLSAGKEYLNRAMGIEPHLEVDYKSFPVEEDDIFIMITDGVHDFVNEKKIHQLVIQNEDLNTCAQQIIEQAISNHSNDNLTCQLIQIDELPQAKENEILSRHENLSFPPLLEPGMILDGYRIEEELHASKRTQIYRAFDTLTNTKIILKTPSILYEDDSYYIEHFLQEEWAGRRISHKNVVKVLATDRPKSCIYYVTELIEGQTVREWILLHQKPLIREVREIVKQIANGLNAFHRMEMLHQDLKPENIMIDKKGIVKIIDFGSVKIAGIAEITPLENGENNILGTLNYTAPEYHLGQRAGTKSDLYSLGVITYEMINRTLPFGRDMPEKPNKINLAKLTYVPSFHENPMVPAWIDDALKKATSISPQLRYEEISEFIHDISKPNPAILKTSVQIPVIERNPLLFWKVTSAILLIINLVLWYLMSKA